MTPELEVNFNEGTGLKGGISTQEMLKYRNRSRVAQVPINDGLLASLEGIETYGDLFVSALRKFGMLCIGIYRYFLIINRLINNKKQ